MRQRRNSIDMCSGPILPKLLQLVVPLMISSVLQLLFHAADIIVVGNFGSENSLAAVGSTGSLVNLLTNLFLGLSVGSNVLAARYIGARDKKSLSTTVHTAICLSLIGGAVLTVIGVLFAEQFLIWMQSPEKVRGLSAQYLQIYFCGMIPMLAYNMGSAILRAKGDTKRPLLYLTLAGILNVCLNLVFVIAFKMDVAGVALATVISQCLSAVLILRCLSREEDEGIRFDWRKLRLDMASVKQILRVGVPASFEGVVFCISNVVLQSFVNGFGEIVMAGCAAAASIEGFVYVSMNAFSQGVMTFTSQNVGAGKYSRINRILLTTGICSGLAGLLFGNMAYFFGEPLLGIYDPRPEIVESGLIRMQFIGRLYFLCGIMDVVGCCIRGMGYSTTPTVVSLMGACALRLLWVFTVFQIPEYHTQTVLFMSYPITWSVTFLAHMGCFFYLRRKLPREDI